MPTPEETMPSETIEHTVLRVQHRLSMAQRMMDASVRQAIMPDIARGIVARMGQVVDTCQTTAKATALEQPLQKGQVLLETEMAQMYVRGIQEEVFLLGIRPSDQLYGSAAFKRLVDHIEAGDTVVCGKELNHLLEMCSQALQKLHTLDWAAFAGAAQSPDARMQLQLYALEAIDAHCPSKHQIFVTNTGFAPAAIFEPPMVEMLPQYMEYERMYGRTPMQALQQYEQEVEALMGIAKVAARDEGQQLQQLLSGTNEYAPVILPDPKPRRAVAEPSREAAMGLGA